MQKSPYPPILFKPMPTILKTKDAQFFFNKIYVLHKSGITLSQIFLQLEKEYNETESKMAFKKINFHINKGETLCRALKVAGIFDDFSLLLIEQGEKSGTLDLSFNFLRKHYENRYKTILLMQKALFYPLVVLPFTALFLLPLPLLFTDGFRAYFLHILPWLFFITLLVFLIKFLKNIWSHDLVFRENMIKRSLHFSFIAHTVKVINTKSFIGPFLAMYEAGIPINNAMAEGLKTAGLNSNNKQTLELEEFPFNFFTDEFSSAFNDGLQTGNFAQVFSNMDEIYQEELQNKVHYISKILPVIIFVIFGAFLLFSLLGTLQTTIKVLDQIN